MRKPAEWFVLTDERILEYLDEVENPASATMIKNSDYVHVSRSTVSKRLHKLAENNLIDQYPNAVFAINERGKGYLNGTYDVQADNWIDESQ